MNANALVLVALDGDHHVRLVQHKHVDLLEVKEVELDVGPVEDLARRADDDVFCELGATLQDLAPYRVSKIFSEVITSYIVRFSPQLYCSMTSDCLHRKLKATNYYASCIPKSISSTCLMVNSG